MLSRTKGIVIKSTVYGEADLIVTFITYDYGLMKAFAKSPRKIKSRFGSSLEPLTYSRLSFFGREDAGLPRLTQSDIITPFYALRDDYNTFVRLCEILELIIHFLPEREPNPAMFSLLLKLLSKIKPGDRNIMSFLYYKVRFLGLAGFLPKLDACGRCGKKAMDGPNKGFHVSHGALICDRCRSGDTAVITLSQSALRFYPSLMTWNFSNIDRVKAPEALVSEISGLIDTHIRYILARPLKAAVFTPMAGNGD
jgi:DNA repair protein RecO (recombination protein O)